MWPFVWTKKFNNKNEATDYCNTLRFYHGYRAENNVVSVSNYLTCYLSFILILLSGFVYLNSKFSDEIILADISRVTLPIQARKLINYFTNLNIIFDHNETTSSRGPRFVLTAEDWSTHRWILDDYLAPHEDISGVDFTSGKCAWSNDEIYANIIQLMKERMTRGDVPSDLNATDPVTHAFLH
ncbi:hypothetical protein I4U23_021861 [Adineta vaga]|nr:hypothetical protein I4U23_021861 [Adineta vaga]